MPQSDHIISDENNLAINTTIGCPSYIGSPLKSVSALLTYRPATEADLFGIARKLRQADRQEIRMASNLEPLAGLTASLHAAAESWVACTAERPIALFGITRWEQYPRFGLIWLLGTVEARRFRKAFLVDGAGWVAHLEQDYDAVGNWVWRGNVTAIRWLEELGFEFPSGAGLDRKDMLFFRKSVRPASR